MNIKKINKTKKDDLSTFRFGLEDEKPKKQTQPIIPAVSKPAQPLTQTNLTSSIRI